MKHCTAFLEIRFELSPEGVAAPVCIGELRHNALHSFLNAMCCSLTWGE